MHTPFPGIQAVFNVMISGDEGIRTLDLSDANRTLSQLSYAPKVRFSRTPIIILFRDGFVKEFFQSFANARMSLSESSPERSFSSIGVPGCHVRTSCIFMSIVTYSRGWRNTSVIFFPPKVKLRPKMLFFLL